MMSQFIHMKPKVENMVTQPGLPTQGKDTTALLCVECGWEGTAVALDNPRRIFLEHKCRLISQSVSVMD